MLKILTIVGIDPGTTTGIAVIDLKGEVVSVKSKKEMGLGDITEFILENGTPVIVATDVHPAPSLVKKVSSAFNAKLYVPEKDLPVKKKNRMTKKYADMDISDHSKDALAAALQAMKSEKDLIKKLEKKTVDLNEEKRELVKEKAIKKEKSISKVIEQVQTEDKDLEDEKNNETEPEPVVNWEEKAKKLDEKLERKEKEIKRLKDYIDDLKDEIDSKKDEIRRLKSDRQKSIDRSEEVKKWKKRYENVLKTSRKRKNNIETLEEELNNFKKALKELNEGKNLYTICKNREELSNVRGSVAFVEKNLETKPPSNVTVVVVPRENEKDFYKNKGLDTVLKNEISGTEVNGFFICDEEDVLSQVDSKEETFIEWLEDYRDRKDV